MLKKWFGKEQKEEEFITDYTLKMMKKGFLVDYDLETWEVIEYNAFDYDGYITQEWALQNGDDVRYLERGEEEGKAECTLTRRIEVQAIEEAVVDAIVQEEEPPELIHYEGRAYSGTESGAGHLREDGTGPGRPFVSWSFAGPDDRVLFLSQWGERDIAAYEGVYVEEYQFTDILPGSQERER